MIRDSRVSRDAIVDERMQLISNRMKRGQIRAVHSAADYLSSASLVPYLGTAIFSLVPSQGTASSFALTNTDKSQASTTESSTTAATYF